VPVNKLSELERRRILDVLNSERFVDQGAAGGVRAVAR
jgi:hypothetical protein